MGAMTSARPPSGPPDSARGSSWTIRLSALVELTARTPAREMVEAPWYSQCNVFWQPIDAAPLTTGGNGYVDGGDLDISGFERKGPNVAQPSDSSAVKLTQGSSY